MDGPRSQVKLNEETRTDLWDTVKLWYEFPVPLTDLPVAYLFVGLHKRSPFSLLSIN